MFGGKYNRLGWNNVWGNGNDVENGEKVKVSKDYGLDCSGFVSWVFINAIGDPGRCAPSVTVPAISGLTRGDRLG